MAQFSKNERLIASALSATPALKAFIKKGYVSINYIIHRKRYRSLVLNLKREINLIEPINKKNETFFGYYDKSPDNDKGLVLFNETEASTSKKPTSNRPIWINTINLKTKISSAIADSFSYNWQQGCRAQWISDEKIIFNHFNSTTRRFEAAVYSIKKKEITKSFAFPVQDAYKDQYFLSINYRRIMRLRPDYGYRNLPLPDDEEMRNLDYDGIWKVDFNSDASDLIVSLKDVVDLQPASNFDSSFHKLNHVMISPNGENFIFIHRWYDKGKRFDRLILFQEGYLRILANEGMVSHMCWINDSILFGFFRHKGVAGFYFININSGEIKSCQGLNSLNNGDGHPTVYKEWIAVDSYPDKSRMQHLTLYNYKTKDLIPILEVFQPLKYQAETRCDMHPRFSQDGKYIFFDTVFTGKRRLAYIDVSSLTHKS